MHMIKNSDGLIAVRHYTSNPTDVAIGATVYHFRPAYNVSLGWVREEDIEAVLNIKANICCGSVANKFRLANQNDVNIHTTGHV